MCPGHYKSIVHYGKLILNNVSLCIAHYETDTISSLSCDAIRQNESDVTQIQFSVLYVVVLGIFNDTFSTKPP